MNGTLFGIGVLSVTGKISLAVIALIIVGIVVFFLIKQAQINYRKVTQILDAIAEDITMNYLP